MTLTKLILTFLFFIFLSTNLYAQYTQWVARYNGTGNGNDGATSIAVDDLGNVYVTGNSSGNGTGTDCVTIKYNSAGVQQWVRRYNGPGNGSDGALSIGVDGLGNVYVAGNSSGYLAIKYNSDGDTVWVRRYNGPANLGASALSAAIDEMGNVHLTGYSVTSNNWSTRFLTIKYNSAGVLQWINTAAGFPSSLCKARSITLDYSGNVYVTGQTGIDTSFVTNWSDWLTVKYNPGGGEQWRVYQDGPLTYQNSEDIAYSVGVDNSGNVYVSGHCHEWEWPFVSYDLTLSYGSGGGWYTWDWPDYLFSSFAPDNSGNMYAITSGSTEKIRVGYPGPIWNKPFGGTCNALVLDSSNNVYVTGSRGGDYGTIKYNSSGVQQWVKTYNGPGNGGDGASSIAVDNLDNVYVTGSSAGIGTGSDYATIKYSPTPSILNSFNLQSPAAGVTIISFPNSTTPITFSWNTSAMYASYKWIFGTSLPVRLITLPIGSDTLSLTMTLGELDIILAGLGVTPGNQLSGAWDVWAFRANPPQNDSLKAANGPRTIILKRGIPALTAFNLSSPPNGTQINTSPFNDTLVHLKWTRSGAGTTYKWKFGSPTIATPLITFGSNGSGYDSVFSIRKSILDSVLASNGLLTGDSLAGEWAVWAYNGVDSLKSVQTWSMILKRITSFVRFYDPFTYGTGNWIITNGRVNCVWQIFSTPYPNSYTLPSTSVSPVFSADADECGEENTLISTATVANNINCVGYENISLEFDNDWNAYNNMDSAIVEASYNSGSTWVPIISWGGTDVRNTHEVKPLPGATNIPNLKVRFRSIQPDWDWWWTIDNVIIKGDLLTGVTKNENKIPSTYALSQNYPNPFNPSTKIKFDIPKSSYVKLIVYDILGREIKILVNEKLNAGKFEVNWPAPTGDGSDYPSGVYFYKLITDDFVDVKKMVLIK